MRKAAINLHTIRTLAYKHSYTYTHRIRQICSNVQLLIESYILMIGAFGLLTFQWESNRSLAWQKATEGLTCPN